MKSNSASFTALVLISLMLGSASSQYTGDPAFNARWYAKEEYRDAPNNDYGYNELLATNTVPMIAYLPFNGHHPSTAHLVPPALLNVTDEYGAHFFAKCSPPSDGTYTFEITSDDGHRVLSNGRIVSDPSDYIVSASVPKYFNLTLLANEEYLWEVHYFESSIVQALEFKVEVNGVFEYVDSDWCTPTTLPESTNYFGVDYRALDWTPAESTESSCQGDAVASATFLFHDVAVESGAVYDLLETYKFGTECMIVRSASDTSNFVALKTLQPADTSIADRYCDMTGSAVARTHGTLRVDGDNACRFRFLIETANSNPAFAASWYNKINFPDWPNNDFGYTDLVATNTLPMIPFPDYLGFHPDFADLVPTEMVGTTGQFGVHFVAKCSPPADGTYTFSIAANDGHRFLHNGNIVTNPLYYVIGPFLPAETFTLDLLASEEYLWEIHYFQISDAHGIEFKVEVNGTFEFVDSEWCRPASIPAPLEFLGNEYRALDWTPATSTESSCQGSGVHSGTFLHHDVAVESGIVYDLLAKYKYGTECMVVRSASNPSVFVALKTLQPSDPNNPDRYCDMTGMNVARTYGSLSVDGDYDCKFRFLIEVSSTDDAFTAIWYGKEGFRDWPNNDFGYLDVLATNTIPMIPFPEYLGFHPDVAHLVPDAAINRTDPLGIHMIAKCSPPADGTYTFSIASNDGHRVLNNGRIVSNPLHYVQGPFLPADIFTMTLLASEEYLWEVHYFDMFDVQGVEFKVEINGTFEYVDSSWCRPANIPDSYVFAGNSYRALDHTPADSTDSSCQGDGIDGGTFEFHDVPIENNDIYALLSRYKFGTECMIVRSAADSANFVALKTLPTDLSVANRYCDMTGINIGRTYGSLRAEGDTACNFRFLIQTPVDPLLEDLSYETLGNDGIGVHSLFFKEALFASLPNVLPETTAGSQILRNYEAFKLPAGYQLAPNDDLTKASLIGSGFSFGTSCVLLADGTVQSTVFNQACAVDSALDSTTLPGYYFVTGNDVAGIYLTNPTGVEADATSTWDETAGGVTPVLYTHVLEHSGSWYGAMTLTPASTSTDNECQNKAYQLPAGYTLVPPGDAGLLEVAKVARFGSSCLVMSDGSGYTPMTGDPCTTTIEQSTHGGITYVATSTCNAVVMMKTAAPAAAPNDKCGTCSSWGTPQTYNTYDGKVYDFFGVGEYWISFATDDTHPTETDLDWYVRALQEKVERAAKYSTIAVKYKNDLIIVDADRGATPATATLTVNGVNTIMTLNQETTLADGAILKMTATADDEYKVTMPNGIVVEIKTGFWLLNHIDISIDLPARYGASAKGLCGNCDGDITNEFTKPDCGIEPIGSSQTDIFNNYGSTWELSSTNAATPSACTPPIDTAVTTGGTDTDVDADPDPCATADPALVQMAENACALLTGQLYESCLVDVCLTGNPGITLVSEEVQNEMFSEFAGPAPSCSIASITQSTTELHGMRYALLDNTDPTVISSGCQTTGLSLPAGWKIAPDTPLHRSALSCYPWGTDCVLFANGNSYTPQLDACRTNDLLKEGPDTDCYRPASCNTRILLVQMPDSDAIVTNRVFAVDPTDSNLAEGWRTITAPQQSYTRSNESVFSNTGEGSIFVSAPDELQTLGALYQANFTNGGGVFGRGFKIGAWARGVGVVPGALSMAADFSLYVDLHFTDGSETLGVYYAPFEGTGSWEFKEVNVMLDPSKTVEILQVYLLFRKHTGDVHFSNVQIDIVDDDQFNLLKQGSLDASTNEWLDLSPLETVSYATVGTDQHVVVDRVGAGASGVSGIFQGVMIRNSDLNQAFEYENDATLNSLFISGTSTASSFTQTEYNLASYYSLYIDLMFADTTTTFGIFEPFDMTVSGEQTVNRVFKPDSQTVQSVGFNALVRNVEGTALYDDLFMTTTCENGATKSPEGGFSYGDPHIRSLDATDGVLGHYDIHAIGEFVLYRDELVEVQTRHSKAGVASVNSAFHIHTPAVDIQIDRTEGTENPVLRIDGRPMIATLGTKSFNLKSAARESSTKLVIAGAVDVETSLSISLDVTTRNEGVQDMYLHKMYFTVHLAEGGDQYLQAFVDPPRQMMNKTQGFLGDYDGNAENDWKVPYQEEPVSTLEEFAEAWRLDPATSAFVYDVGVDGTEFTDMDFKPTTIESFPQFQQEEAKSFCKELGVAAAVQDACVFDVLVGGKAYGQSGYTPVIGRLAGSNSVESLVLGHSELHSSADQAIQTSFVLLVALLAAALV